MSLGGGKKKVVKPRKLPPHTRKWIAVSDAEKFALTLVHNAFHDIEKQKNITITGIEIKYYQAPTKDVAPNK